MAVDVVAEENALFAAAAHRLVRNWLPPLRVGADIDDSMVAAPDEARRTWMLCTVRPAWTGRRRNEV